MEILASIDELTLTFRLDEMTAPDLWQKVAEKIIDKVSENMKLGACFGNKVYQSKGSIGYDTVITFGDTYFFFLGYNSLRPSMGIILKFSAEAFKFYCQRYVLLGFAKNLEAYDVVKLFGKVKDDFLGKCRVTKADLAIDFFDYPDLTVNALYQGIDQKQILIVNSKGRLSAFNVNATVNNGVTNTVYIGSRKKNSSALLRIYNKKQEEEDNVGPYLLKARSVDSWIRFEASFRKDYAHQIGSVLEGLTSSVELSKLIFSCLTDKYIFTLSDKQTVLNFSQDMIDLSGVGSPLFSEEHRNNDLLASADYFKKSSGLTSLLYKIEQLYGRESVKDYLADVLNYLDNGYQPNADVDSFLIKYGDDYQKLLPPWQGAVQKNKHIKFIKGSKPVKMTKFNPFE